MDEAVCQLCHSQAPRWGGPCWVCERPDPHAPLTWRERAGGIVFGAALVLSVPAIALVCAAVAVDRLVSDG